MAKFKGVMYSSNMGEEWLCVMHGSVTLPSMCNVQCVLVHPFVLVCRRMLVSRHAHNACVCAV